MLPKKLNANHAKLCLLMMSLIFLMGRIYPLPDDMKVKADLLTKNTYM